MKSDAGNLELDRVQRDAPPLESRFGSLLESTPDAIVMINPDGRIVLANSQSEKLFGYAPGELRGRLIEVLIPDRFRQAHVGQRADYFGHPQRRPLHAGLELYGLRKNGVEFPVEISLSPLRPDGGLFVMSAIRDITERKQIENELKEKNAALEAANEELEAFSYSVSHDLHAPARAMDGFAGILARKLGDQLRPEIRQVLGRIQENAALMGRLIDGLLIFSRFNRQPLAKSVVAPSALARSAMNELQQETAGRNIRANIGELPQCEADPVLLRQVFANLLSNAVKYSRRRDPAVIEVGARQNNGEVIYFVRDNGAGFDMEYSAKLFRVFQRLHSAAEFEGTGVGLAIVQRIVQRHGGRVWAESKVGGGATFYFTLNTAEK